MPTIEPNIPTFHYSNIPNAAPLPPMPARRLLAPTLILALAVSAADANAGTALSILHDPPGNGIAEPRPLEGDRSVRASG